MNDAKDKDLVMWEQWRRTKSTMDLEALVQQMMPILRREIMRWGSLAPSYVLENEAKRIAIGAFNDYRPNSGASLSTFLTSRLQKLSRTAYQGQSTLSIPEHMRLGYNKYRAAEAHLTDLNGKRPEIHEVADYLGVPPKRLQSLVETVGKRELTESGDGPEFVKHVADDVLDLAYAGMTPLQKEIFKLRTGYDNSPVMSASGIMKKLNITQGTLSYQLTLIKALLQHAQQLR